MIPAPAQSVPLPFSLIDPTAASEPVVRAVYKEIERELGLGAVPDLFRAMAQEPAILRATWDLFRTTVLRGVLPRSLKAMIGVVVAAASTSAYALKAPLHSLAVQGISTGILNTLATGDTAVYGLAPSVTVVLRIAHCVAAHGPGAVDETDLVLLRDEGVSQEELTEVLATIDLFRYIYGFTDLVRAAADAI